MSVPEIKQLDQLIKVGKLVHQKVERLTAPGENYGSLILSVEVTFETRNGNRKIYAVAKMVPPSEFLQKVFNTGVTFRNEIAFYKNIIPLLQNFQRENEVNDIINVAPNYLGSRLNLIGGDRVDNEAILVLENLKMEKYQTMDRKSGLDLEVTKLVLKDLAYLHAVPLAFKLKKPKIFEEQIKPFLTGFQMTKELFHLIKRDIDKIIDQVEELHQFRERILKGFDHLSEKYEIREPFATIVHEDCWINNSMVKFDGTIPIKSKLVDFQLCSYGSPARDIVFFLFTSVKNEVLLKNYNDLLEYYHKIVVSILGRLKCDLDFTFEELLKEIDHEAKCSQFGHISQMLLPIFAEKLDVSDVSEISPESMTSAAENVSDKHKEKFIFIVKEFMKRDWL